MQNVLVIEDDPEVRRFLAEALAGGGFAVTEAASAAQGEALAQQGGAAAILLDLGLPDLDGMEVLAHLRARGQTPVIVVSSRDGDADKIDALDAGADDYVTKPFSTPELLARLRVALRHARPREADPPVLEVGPIRIDHARHEVTVDGSPVHLTPIEFRLLEELARRAGKVMTHHQLLEAVWGPGKATETHYLRVHMQALRRKIERVPARPRWLTTETGIGYRLRDQ